jgi:hypothetical protein
MIRGNSWLVVQMGTYFCASKTLPILCRAQGCLNQLRATTILLLIILKYEVDNNMVPMVWALTTRGIELLFRRQAETALGVNFGDYPVISR